MDGFNLSDISALYVGDTPYSAIYMGDTKIWDASNPYYGWPVLPFTDVELGESVTFATIVTPIALVYIPSYHKFLLKGQSSGGVTVYQGVGWEFEGHQASEYNTSKSARTDVIFHDSETGCYWVYKDNTLVNLGTEDPTGGTGILSVDPTTLSFSSVNESKELVITSNISWQIAVNDLWLSVNQNSGSGNAVITVTTTANTSTDSRTTTINVAGGDIRKVVSVSQEGAEPEPPQPTTLELKPVMVDSSQNTNIITSLSDSSNIDVVGSCIFLFKANGVDLSNVSISYTNIPPHVTAERIDNWGYIMRRLFRHGDWAGGLSTGSFPSESIVFGYNSKEITAKFIANLNESITELFEGCYVDKVLKAPALGHTGTVKYNLYPYTFNSPYYGNAETNVYLLDYNNNYATYVYRDGAFYDEDTIKYNLSDTIFSSLACRRSGITVYLDYTIKKNVTTEFKDIALLFRTYNNYTLVHFLQEPDNTHRIYYGTNFDSYYVDKENNSDGEFLFHNLGSMVLGNNNTFTTPSGWSYVVYPQALSNDYNITIEPGSGSTVHDYISSENLYKWNGASYICKANWNAVTYTFTKK